MPGHASGFGVERNRIMEKKYTPFTVRQNDGPFGSDDYTILTGHGNFFARTYSSADAKLIAAAPELLQIAIAYRNLLKTMSQTEDECATFTHIESVISKVI